MVSRLHNVSNNNSYIRFDLENDLTEDQRIAVEDVNDAIVVLSQKRKNTLKYLRELAKNKDNVQFHDNKNQTNGSLMSVGGKKINFKQTRQLPYMKAFEW